MVKLTMQYPKTKIAKESFMTKVQIAYLGTEFDMLLLWEIKI